MGRFVHGVLSVLLSFVLSFLVPIVLSDVLSVVLVVLLLCRVLHCRCVPTCSPARVPHILGTRFESHKQARLDYTLCCFTRTRLIAPRSQIRCAYLVGFHIVCTRVVCPSRRKPALSKCASGQVMELETQLDFKLHVDFAFG